MIASKPRFRGLLNEEIPELEMMQQYPLLEVEVRQGQGLRAQYANFEEPLDLALTLIRNGQKNWQELE